MNPTILASLILISVVSPSLGIRNCKSSGRVEGCVDTLEGKGLNTMDSVFYNEYKQAAFKIAQLAAEMDKLGSKTLPNFNQQARSSEPNALTPAAQWGN